MKKNMKKISLNLFFSFKENKYEDAKIYILNARNEIDDKIKTLLT